LTGRGLVAVLLVATLAVGLAAALYLLPIGSPGTVTSSSSSTLSSSSTGSHPNSTIPVGGVYYLWYGNITTGTGGLGSPGWDSHSCPGGGVAVDQPNIGYYVSDSNQTFQTQIAEMRSAGLSFAVVSWWGPFTAGEAGAVNKATLDLFRYLKGTNSTFKVAIMIDSFETSCGLPTAPMSQVYDYIQSTYALPFSQWYFDWQGKPLLMVFNTGDRTFAPLYNDTRFTSKLIGNYACVPVETCPNHSLNQALNWVWWDAPAQYFQGQGGTYNVTNDEGQPVISADGEVTIVPRTDSYFDRAYQNGSYLRFDASLTEGLYEEQWNYVLSQRSSIHLVIIYSWNEYHERTAIEPHVDGNNTLPEGYLLSVTARYDGMLDPSGGYYSVGSSQPDE